MNFKEQPIRRGIYGSTRGIGSSSSYATRVNRPRGPNIRGSSTATDRLQMNDRRKTHMRLGVVIPGTGNWSHANQGRSHPSDLDRGENPKPLSESNDAQAG